MIRPGGEEGRKQSGEGIFLVLCGRLWTALVCNLLGWSFTGKTEKRWEIKFVNGKTASGMILELHQLKSQCSGCLLRSSLVLLSDYVATLHHRWRIEMLVLEQWPLPSRPKKFHLQTKSYLLKRSFKEGRTRSRCEASESDVGTTMLQSWNGLSARMPLSGSFCFELGGLRNDKEQKRAVGFFINSRKDCDWALPAY